jgi:hypothetical protein
MGAIIIDYDIFCLDSNSPPQRHGIPSIQHQVNDHLLNISCICINHPEIFSKLKMNCHILSEHLLKHFLQFPQILINIDKLF